MLRRASATLESCLRGERDAMSRVRPLSHQIARWEGLFSNPKQPPLLNCSQSSRTKFAARCLMSHRAFKSRRFARRAHRIRIRQALDSDANAAIHLPCVWGCM